MSRRGRTGGGKGTNQYVTRGTAKEKPKSTLISSMATRSLVSQLQAPTRAARVDENITPVQFDREWAGGIVADFGDMPPIPDAKMIGTFIDVLDSVNPELAANRKEAAEVLAKRGDLDKPDSKVTQELANQLTIDLDSSAPPGTYFGRGSGTNAYGFWPLEEAI